MGFVFGKNILDLQHISFKTGNRYYVALSRRPR